MRDRRGWHPLPAPRALAELPLQAALAHTQRLAGAWTLALIRSRPLEEIGLLPLGELARAAPQLCAQLVAAVHSDAELERLRGAGERPAGEPPAATAARVGELTGARDAREVVEALELLRGILCEALAGELAEPTPRQSADLCERVAHVCATVLAVALGPAPDASPAQGGPPSAAPGPPATLRETPASAAGGALIVDELESTAASGSPFEAARGEPVSERPVDDAGPAIEIRDERAEHPAVAWIAAIAGQLERYEADRLPFAVLLVELREIERLRLETSPAELAALGASLETVLAAKLPDAGPAHGPAYRGAPPWTGSLTPQRPGRCWVLAPETDRLGAHSLADRITRAVAAALSHRGRALDVLVGIAVCPQDGRQAAALAAHADIDLHAARAARR